MLESNQIGCVLQTISQVSVFLFARFDFLVLSFIPFLHWLSSFYLSFYSIFLSKHFSLSFLPSWLIVSLVSILSSFLPSFPLFLPPHSSFLSSFLPSFLLFHSSFLPSFSLFLPPFCIFFLFLKVFHNEWVNSRVKVRFAKLRICIFATHNSK